jgi:hypothetical protein
MRQSPTLRHLVLLPLLAACAVHAPQPWSQPGDGPDALASPATFAQGQRPADSPRRQGDRVALIGLGFTDSPDTTLLGGEVDFYQSEQLAIGPMLQLGLDDDTTILAPSFQAKYHIPVKVSSYPRPAPFVQGGVGLVWMDKDRRGRDDDDLGLLLHVGGGLELMLDDRLALASTLTINLMPAKVVGERAFLSWQILQFGFRF